jgi:hypothetical protein
MKKKFAAAKVWAIALLLVSFQCLYSQTATINFNTSTGVVVDKKAFGLNGFQAFDPSYAGNTTYRTNMAEMNPGLIRYHSWNMIASGHGSDWLNADRRTWNATKINTAMSGANSYGPAIMMNIPWPDAASGWLDAAGRLKTANYTDFANFCASLVQIVNVNQSRGVKYWEITNERDDLYNGNCAELGVIYNRCVDAMKLKDNTIKCGGPAFVRPDLIANVDAFINTSSSKIDFLSYHSYLNGDVNATNASVYNASSVGWQDASMKTEWNKYSTRTIEYFHNEYNISWNPPDAKQTNGVGLVSDAISLISIVNNGGLGAAWNECDGWYGKMDNSYNKRPSYYLYKIFNTHLRNATIYTSSSSDNNKLVTWAAKGADGWWKVVLVNRADADISLTCNLSGLPASVNNSSVVYFDAARNWGYHEQGATTIGGLKSTFTLYNQSVVVFSFNGNASSGSTTYNIYTDNGTNNFANDGGTTASYAMTVTNQTSGAPEGTNYRKIAVTNHYASYRFEYAAAGINKSSWSSSFLEFSARTTSDFDVYLEDGAGVVKYLPLSNYITKSGSWETVKIPISAFTGIDLSRLRRIGFYRLWNAAINLDFDNVRVTGSGAARVASPSITIDTPVDKVITQLYPNPANEYIDVTFSLLENAAVDLRLTDAASRTKMTKKYLAQKGINKLQLSLAGFNSGVYLLTITTGSKIITKKIVVNKE